METFRTRVGRLCAALALLFSGATLAADPPSADGVSPIVVDGVNVTTCSDINADIAPYGISIDATVAVDEPSAGDFTAPDGTTFHITFDPSTGQVGWSASTGIDAVAVKGGHGANIYVYDPTINGQDDESKDATSDSGLFTPLLCGNANNERCGFSHMVFCYDYHLQVSKTADPTFTRTYPWTLSKSVSPTPLNLFNGDSGDVVYTVTATKGAPVDSNFTMGGTVTITNPAPFAVTIVSITDHLNDGTPISLSCPTGTLAAHATETCSYGPIVVSGVSAGGSKVNTVTVTTSGDVGWGSASATATFTTPGTIVNDSIVVTDSDPGAAGAPWTFSGTGSVNYGKTFDCTGQGNQPTYSYTFDNTVSTTANGVNPASAEVVVNCYSLAVSKTANTSFNRAWVWNITKSYVSPQLTVDTNNDGTADALLLSANQSVNLGYTVTVSATSSDNTDAVSGTITISNNNSGRSATLLGVIDVVSTALNMSVSCPSSTVPAGGWLQCTYSGSLPDKAARTNVATATQQNYHYAANGAGTPAGSTQYSGMAAVTFGAPANLVDQCISLSDAFNGGAPAALGGSICAPAAGGNWSQTVNYTASFTWDPALGTCKTIAVPNVASFLTNTTGATGSSTATINITNRDCAQGCTLTQGYWKTHSKYGPAKSDPTWNLLQPNGPDTTFFYSGESWYQAFWTTPAGGNAYWVLAHQYEAAVLNQLNGASQPTHVQSVISQAYGLFNNPTNTPAYIGGLKSNNSLRQQFISDAALLDMYNNGNYPGGPAHCSEDSASNSSP